MSARDWNLNIDLAEFRMEVAEPTDKWATQFQRRKTPPVYVDLGLVVMGHRLCLTYQESKALEEVEELRKGIVAILKRGINPPPSGVGGSIR